MSKKYHQRRKAQKKRQKYRARQKAYYRKKNDPHGFGRSRGAYNGDFSIENPQVIILLVCIFGSFLFVPVGFVGFAIFASVMGGAISGISSDESDANIVGWILFSVDIGVALCIITCLIGTVVVILVVIACEIKKKGGTKKVTKRIKKKKKKMETINSYSYQDVIKENIKLRNLNDKLMEEKKAMRAPPKIVIIEDSQKMEGQKIQQQIDGYGEKESVPDSEDIILDENKNVY